MKNIENGTVTLTLCRHFGRCCDGMRRVPADVRPPGAAAVQSHLLLLVRQGRGLSVETLRHVPSGDPRRLPAASAAARSNATGTRERPR